MNVILLLLVPCAMSVPLIGHWWTGNVTSALQEITVLIAFHVIATTGPAMKASEAMGFVIVMWGGRERPVASVHLIITEIRVRLVTVRTGPVLMV